MTAGREGTALSREEECPFTEEHERAIGLACEKLWNDYPPENPIHTPRPRSHPLRVVGDEAHAALNAALALRTTYFAQRGELQEARAELAELKRNAGAWFLCDACGKRQSRHEHYPACAYCKKGLLWPEPGYTPEDVALLRERADAVSKHCCGGARDPDECDPCGAITAQRLRSLATRLELLLCPDKAPSRDGAA